MKNLILLSVFISTIFMFSCGKEAKFLYENNNVAIPWYQKYPDTVKGVSMRPVILDDKVIFSAIDLNTQKEIFAMNKKTGETMWRWKDYHHPTDHMPSGDHKNIVYKNLFVFNINGYIYAVDHNTGKTVWCNTNYAYGSSYELCQLGSDIYYPGSKTKAHDKYDVIKLNMDSQKSEVVASFDGNIWRNPTQPIVRVENGKDTIMYISARKKQNDQHCLIAFNITTRKTVYEVELQPSEIGDTKIDSSTPVFYNDKIILVSSITLALDAKTGKRLWHINMNDKDKISVGNRYNYIEKNIMYVGQQDFINVIDLDTGLRLTPFSDQIGEFSLLDDLIIQYNPRKYNEKVNIRSIINVRKQDGTFLFELNQTDLKDSEIPAFFIGSSEVDKKERVLYISGVNSAMRVNLK